MFSSAESLSTHRASMRLEASSITPFRQLRPAVLQPGVLAGIPLHQFAHSRATRPPLMDLLDALPSGMPQVAFDHPRPHRLASCVNVVFASKVLRRWRWTETAIDIATQYFHRLPLVVSPSLRLDGRPRGACTKTPSPLSCRRFNIGRTCLSLWPRSSAAASRWRSRCVMKSDPESTSQARPVNRTFVLGTSRTFSFGGNNLLK